MSTTQPTTTPTAADYLRAALEDAGTLRVEADAFGDLRIWDEDDQQPLEDYPWDEQAPTMRLLGLLLAAAPALPALLDALATNTDPTAPARALRLAVTQAGGSL